MKQMDWQRSVIREEMYESMSLRQLNQRALSGDEDAKKEWSRRWEEDFPKMKNNQGL